MLSLRDRPVELIWGDYLLGVPRIMVERFDGGSMTGEPPPPTSSDILCLEEVEFRRDFKAVRQRVFLHN